MRCPSKKAWSDYWSERPDTELAAHLQTCSACREKADGYQQIIKQVRAADCGEPDETYWPELKRTILSSLPAEPSGSFWQRLRLDWGMPLLRPGMALAVICLAITAYFAWPTSYSPAPLQQESPEQLAAWLVETDEASVLEAANQNWSDDWAWSQSEAAQYFETAFSVEEAVEHFNQNELSALDQQISWRSL